MGTGEDSIRQSGLRKTLAYILCAPNRHVRNNLESPLTIGVTTLLAGSVPVAFVCSRRLPSGENRVLSESRATRKLARP